MKYQKKCAIDKKRFHNMVVYLQCLSIMYNRFLRSEGPNSINRSQFSLKITFIYFSHHFVKKKKKSYLFHWDLIFIWKERLKYIGQFICIVEIQQPLFLPYNV